ETAPDVGRSSPPSICSRVDFPPPVGPCTATSSPSPMVSDTPRSARTTRLPWRYVLVRSWSWYMSAFFVVVSPGTVVSGQGTEGLDGAQPRGAPSAGDPREQPAQHREADRREHDPR